MTILSIYRDVAAFNSLQSFVQCLYLYLLFISRLFCTLCTIYIMIIITFMTDLIANRSVEQLKRGHRRCYKFFYALVTIVVLNLVALL